MDMTDNSKGKYWHNQAVDIPHDYEQKIRKETRIILERKLTGTEEGKPISPKHFISRMLL